MIRIIFLIVAVSILPSTSVWAQEANSAFPKGTEEEPSSSQGSDSLEGSGDPQDSPQEPTGNSEDQDSSDISSEGLEDRIAAIQVEGNRRVDKEVVVNALRSKVGELFNPFQAQEDVRSVWRLGLFSDVQIFVDDSQPSGLVLIVQVSEKPTVRETQIRGNEELSNDDLKDLVEVKPFTILDQSVVQRSANKIQEKYVEKGYFLSEVNPVVKSLGNNEVAVYFDVNEHAKVEVKRITFVGNEKVPDKDLLAHMETSEGGIFSFITSSGTFRKEAFQRDLGAIAGVYYDRGFINVRVGNPQISLSPDRKFVFLTITIEENDQYTIGDIDFSGDLIVSKDELREKITLEKGELFNRTKLSQDLMGLADIYYDAGYAYANIVPQTDVDAEKKIVGLTFDVQKGQKVYVERIEIVGNHRTRDKVIRRELQIFEGDLYSGSKLRLSRARVGALGFFEAVDITQKRGTTDNTVIITVSVKEKPTGSFQIGFGLSSLEDYMLNVQISENNLFGWGQTGSFMVQWGKLRKLFEFSFSDYHFFDTRWIFAANAFRQDTDYSGYLREATGGGVSLGYNLTPELKLVSGYAIEDIKVEPGGASGKDLLASQFRGGLSSKLNLRLEWDQRNNRLFATSGNFQSAQVEYSPSWLGANILYTRYSLNSRWYKSLGWGFVLKAQGSLGYINGDDVPSSELYYAGGIAGESTLRGYEIRTVSPTIRVGNRPDPDSALTPSSGVGAVQVGGNKQLIFNFELEFPIADKLGIRGVAFYDVGNVYAAGENFLQSKTMKLPLGMLHSVGIGFRWFSPMGPFRFEWGFPLTPRPGDEPYDFQISIGSSF